MLKAKYNGFDGTIIQEQTGRLLINFGFYNLWVIKGAPGLEVCRDKAGRPRKFSNNAEKQRAYRARKSGKALRNYKRASPS